MPGRNNEDQPASQTDRQTASQLDSQPASQPASLIALPLLLRSRGSAETAHIYMHTSRTFTRIPSLFVSLPRATSLFFSSTYLVVESFDLRARRFVHTEEGGYDRCCDLCVTERERERGGGENERASSFQLGVISHLALVCTNLRIRSVRVKERDGSRLFSILVVVEDLPRISLSISHCQCRLPPSHTHYTPYTKVKTHTFSI